MSRALAWFRPKETPSRAHYERTSVFSDAVKRFLFIALAGFVQKGYNFAVLLRGGRTFALSLY